MTYQVLARKWRPRDFASLVGQEHVVRALTHALEQQRLHHAYLFTGTRGVGKTTLSRILAKALNCETGITAVPCGVCKACRAIDEGRFIDYVEMDAASNRGVDEMAALLERAVYAPVDARFKVYMIDEVHMLTNHAFNAMLKTLEEPPAHVKFILATTDPQKIPVTVLSRCLQFNLKQMPATHIVTHLEHVLAQEQIAYETQALRLLARAADGSMRDALSLTDQAIAYAAGTVSEEAIRGMLGALDQSYLIRLLDAVAAADGAGVLAIADEMAARSLSFSVALQDLASLLHRIAWAQHAPASVLDEWPEAAEIRRFAAQLSAQDIQLYYQIATLGRSELGVAPDEYAGFTMSLLRMLAFQPAGLAGAGGGSAPASPAPGAGLPVHSRAPAVAAQPGAAAGKPAQSGAAVAQAAVTPAAHEVAAPGIVSPAAPGLAAPAADEVAAPVAVAAAVAAPEPGAPASAEAAASQAHAPAVSEMSPAPETLAAHAVPAAAEAPAAAFQAAASPAAAPAAAVAHNPARAALDALRSAGLKISPDRKRGEAVPPRAAQAPARASAATPGMPPPRAPQGPAAAALAAGHAAAMPAARPAPVRAAPARAAGMSAGASAAAQGHDAADFGSTIAPWDDMPPDDDYDRHIASGADAFEPPVYADYAAPNAPQQAYAVEPGAGAVPSMPAMPPAQTAPATAPASQIDLAPLGFDGNWPALAALLPLKGLAQQLAYQSEAIGLEGNTLKLRAAAPLTDAAQVAKLKAALLEQLGRAVQLDVVAGVAAWSAAAVDSAQRAVRQREADQTISQDTFVQSLLRDFDARIVPGSIRPIQ